MTTLIFEPNLSGHHLEYLHHYYLGALERPQEKFFFLVSRKFNDVKGEFEWTPAANISIQFIDKKYDSYFSSKNVYKLGWNTSKVLRDYVKLWHPDKVVLTMLMQFIPFICLLLPKTVRVRGIMYKIYLYEQSKMSRIRLLAERIRFWIASHSKVVERIFVLNDEDSAMQFNKIYKTDKFCFLPDPVPEIDISTCKDIRFDLGIRKEKKVFLHFGGLAIRKGTIDILRTLEKMDDNDLSMMTFVFAGRQSDALKKDFYPLYNNLKHRVQIFVFDEFCSYEFLYNLCYSSDIILMPYHDTNLSSGIIGYAAIFNKPVIGPNNGLIGNLINKFGLGICVDTSSPTGLLNAITYPVVCYTNNYKQLNSKINFINCLFSNER